MGTMMTDAIINSGPRKASANLIWINRVDRRARRPCFGHGASSGARSCRRLSPGSGRIGKSRWTL